MKDVPPAVNETDPRSVFPFALFGVLKRHEATPLAVLLAPFILTLPIEAEQVTRVGRTGEPPFVIRTAATTVEPAFGFAGESFTALVVAAALPPPPPEPPPLPEPPPEVGSVTSNLNLAVLLEGSGSGSVGSTDAVIS